jgi:SAM-dependent methyltransferase
MAATCPAGFDVPRLRAQARDNYERVEHAPDGDFHVHRGLDYAVDSLSYDRAELTRLPAGATARFAGVGNPLRIGPLRAGETVLDHACGAGMDLLLAASRVGSGGRAIGVEANAGRRASAQESAEEAGLGHIVDIREGDLDVLPVDDRSVDVVISNAVINFSRHKARVFEEIYRVLKPGGRLYLAGVMLQRGLRPEARSSPDVWAAGIGGALLQNELADLAAQAGLKAARVVETFDCFRGTSLQQKLAKDLRPIAVNFLAVKGAPQ